MNADEIDWAPLLKASAAYCKRISQLSEDEFMAALERTGWPLDVSLEKRVRRAFREDPCLAFYALSRHEIDIDAIDEGDPRDIVAESWQIARKVAGRSLPSTKPQVTVAKKKITIRIGAHERTVENLVDIPAEVLEMANELLTNSAEEIRMLPPSEPSLPVVFVAPEVWERALKEQVIPEVTVYLLEEDE
jgi:hypothetical protein